MRNMAAGFVALRDLPEGCQDLPSFKKQKKYQEEATGQSRAAAVPPVPTPGYSVWCGQQACVSFP